MADEKKPTEKEQPEAAAPATPAAMPQGEKKPKQPKGEKGEKGGKGGKGAKAPKAPEPEPEGPPAEPAPRARLLDFYEQRVRAKLQQQFGFKNLHQIPRLLKIVLNVGMGDAPKNPKGLEAAVTELAVAVSIAAILATLAVPSFNNLVASQRAKTTASELFASLLKTRSEAIMRNASITLGPTNGSWSNGWQIKDSATPANVLDDRGAPTGVTITAPSVTFSPSGRVQAGTTPTFLISTTSGSSTNYQCISLDLGGRPNIQAASSC